MGYSPHSPVISAKYDWVLRSSALHVPSTSDEVLSLLLRLRGVSEEQQASFLAPVYEDALHHPSTLPDFPAAVERILHARDRGESVAIFGDYDVDGVTASAVLADAFRLLGLSPRVLLPHREEDGYGLSVDAVRELIPPATLLVTVDNGTSAHEAVREAKTRGADVIIIDHHTVQGTVPPGALVVNPARPGHAYPFSRLSAVGLAFKLARELLITVGRGGEEKWLLDLVALGTLADRVPLVGENRGLVQWGLRVLREGRRMGLATLASHARVSLPVCDAHAVSFQLVPRLNAAGRMRHADLALRLLTTHDPTEAGTLAEMLEQINKERRTLTDRVVKDIQETLIRSVPLPDMLCVSGPWPAGVLGILAGRLAEEIGRPAVVIGVGETTCVASVRGNRTVNVVDLVAEIASSLTKFGGHAEAAGFSFPLAALPDVERYFATLKFSASSPPQAPLPIDCPLKPGLVTSDVARQLRVLEPHGEGNECPVFVVEDLHVADVRPIGSTGEHQRFFLSHPSLHGETVAAVAFRWNGRPVPGRGDRIDVATEVWVDRYHHREQVDLHLRDLQTHEESKEANAGVSWSRKAHGRGAP